MAKGKDDRTPWSAELSPEGDLRLAQSYRSSLADFVDNIHRTAGIPGAMTSARPSWAS
jgi:hypothetical protein